MKIEHYVTEGQDNDATWRFLKHAYKPCPHCKAAPMFQEVRQYMTLWKDGFIFCNNCESFLGEYEETVEPLKAQYEY